MNLEIKTLTEQFKQTRAANNDKKSQILAEKISNLYSKLEKLSEEKIELSENVYNQVDSIIQTVDTNITEFDKKTRDFSGSHAEDLRAKSQEISQVIVF